MSNYLFAYATNINDEEMHKHCPNAIFRGYAILNGYALEFCGYDGHAIATLTADKKSSVNVAVWEMSPEDYYTIGNYEAFPYMYKRVDTTAILYGKKIKGQIYLPKQQLQKGMPSQDYLNEITKAYTLAGLNVDVIKNAIQKVKRG